MENTIKLTGRKKLIRQCFAGCFSNRQIENDTEKKQTKQDIEGASERGGAYTQAKKASSGH